MPGRSGPGTLRTGDTTRSARASYRALAAAGRKLGVLHRITHPGV
ncbi:hypothetical protein [Amycolatopsis jejuensis]|nr:hypothetical protein [Amycolatopsis jejuensis]